MVYSAEKKNVTLQFLIEPILMGFEGSFYIQIYGLPSISFNSDSVRGVDEWSLVKELLVEAEKTLKKYHVKSDDLINSIWNKFFDSKQNKFNFGVN